MSLYSYFRISKVSAEKVPQARVDAEYRRLRSRTFWGSLSVYSLYYVCRLTLSVVKQPLIDDGVLSAGQLGIIGSAMLLAYAVGRFLNGFVADHCNVRRFMATGILISAAINLVLGCLGLVLSSNVTASAGPLASADGTSSSALASSTLASAAVPSFVVMAVFVILWAGNGLAQSMGASPGVVSLSRWYPLKTRGTWYSIFSAAPYVGEVIAFVSLGWLATHIGWESCFIVSSVAGLAAGIAAIVFITDTPQSAGLPSVQEYSGETLTADDTKHTSELQKAVLRHPGIWVIALSSAFVYITKYAIAGWGVLFLQKEKGLALDAASHVIAFYAFFGVVGTVIAGWLSDRVFRGDRAKPALLSGIVSVLSLGAFLFGGGGVWANIAYVSVFSLSVGVLYCIVAGLMSIDIVPRKATGAAMGVVGLFCYIAASIQDSVSGWLIQAGETDGVYDFLSVSVFWLAASVFAFVLPVVFWRKLKKK